MTRLLFAAALFALSAAPVRAESSEDLETVAAEAEGTAPEVDVVPMGVWDRLAICESNSRWDANTGNGYYGGTQTDMPTWRRYGGPAFAPRADLASRAQQIAINERILIGQGWGAWPVCSRVAGLR